MKTKQKSLLMSIGAGILAGAAGTFVMEKTMPYLQRLQPEKDKQREAEVSGEGSVIKTAKMVSDWLNLDLDEKQLGKFSYGIHWAYGLTWGGIFGAIHYFAPGLTRYAAIPFGVGFYAIGDQTIPPIFGVAPAGNKFPASMHARDLAGHLVYTFTADGVFHAIADGTQSAMDFRERRGAA